MTGVVLVICAGVKIAKLLDQDKIVVINLSGRGDKDVQNIYENSMKQSCTIAR